MMAVIKKLRKKTTASKAKKTTTKTKARTSAKKTTAKTTRKKISSQELFALIEKKAYELYINRGYTHGDDLRDWYEAELAVKKSLKK